MPGHTCIVLGSLVLTSHGFVWDDAYVWDGGSCMHLPLANASDISHTSKIWHEGERRGGVPPFLSPPSAHEVVDEITQLGNRPFSTSVWFQ